MQRWIIGTSIFLLLIAAGIFLAKQRENQSTSPTATTATETQPPSPSETTSVPTSPTSSATTTPLIELTFGLPKKSAHYVSNTPAHAEILTSSAKEIVIRFNFDLTSISTISIMKDNIEYGSDETKVSVDQQSLTRALKNDLPNGVYTVSYTACWPDGSCHDGHFQFGIQA